VKTTFFALAAALGAIFGVLGGGETRASKKQEGLWDAGVATASHLTGLKRLLFCWGE
jgi:hypothetical protein